LTQKGKPGRITAHVKRVMQDQTTITTLIMSEGQMRELLSLLAVALREQSTHPDGYHLAIWKQNRVQKCQANPPCEGGNATVNLVRPRKKANDFNQLLVELRRFRFLLFHPHAFAPTIFSGRTISSNSSPFKNPSSMHAWRSVLPSAWAFLATLAALS
jgi:hypothetical protein